MTNSHDSILANFVEESRKLVTECLEILERVDGKTDNAAFLENYSNRIDRIMGAARSLAEYDQGHALVVIGECTNLCKVLSMKGAKVPHQPKLFQLIVAFLTDATEHVSHLLNWVGKPSPDLREASKDVLVDRLKWIMELVKVPEDNKPPAAADNLAQREIDALMKKLGG